MNINLSTSSKKIILKVFLALILILNAGILTVVYHRLNPKIQNQDYYDVFLNQYLYEYKKNEDAFQNFSFYVNYDKLFFEDNTIKYGYEQAVNYFSNITQQQFYGLFTLVKEITKKREFAQVSRFGYNHSDWARKDAVIRDQKGFNTSFIFACLTAMQYQINKQNNQTWVTLSAQQIIDCCPTCMSTKQPQKVFEYIAKNGVLQQKQYPYQNSRFDTIPKACRLEGKGRKTYYVENIETIKNCAKASKQISKYPFVVGVDGRQFPNYKYSIFKDCQRRVTHYATLVGDNPGYWKIQNSWGKKWGERGFMRIGPGDSCGICIRGVSAKVIKK